MKKKEIENSRLTSVSKLNWLIENWLPIAIIMVIIVLVFGQTLKYEFTNYDDDRLIVMRETFFSDHHNILEAFKTDVFGERFTEGPIFYRPILTLSFMIDYNLYGLKSGGFHFSNLFIHFICAVIVYFFIFRLIGTQNIALLATLIFCVHPVQVETVAWLAGRNDLLLGLFILLMMVCYTNYRSNPSKIFYYFFAAPLFMLAVFTKEPAISFLVLIPLYDLIFNDDDMRKMLSLKSVTRFFLFLVIIGVYFLARYSVFDVIFKSGGLYTSESFFSHIIQAPYILLIYLQLLLFPCNLSILHPVPVSAQSIDLTFILSTIIIVGLILIPLKFKQINKQIKFGIFWILCTLLPASNIIPTPVPILEHRLYVPMIGLCILIAGLLKSLQLNDKNYRYTDIISYAVVLILGIISFMRTPVWKNSEVLWTEVIQKGTMADLPYNNLGVYYNNSQQYEKAIQYLEKGVSLNTNQTDIIVNLGYAYLQTGRYNEAIAAYEHALQMDKNNLAIYLNLGRAYRSLKNYDEASLVYQNGLRVNSNSTELHYEFGLLCGLMRNDSLAEIELKKAISLDTKYAPAYFSLGAMYSSQKNDSKTIAFINEGMKYQTPSADMYYVLGKSYYNIGDTLKAKYFYNIYRSSR
jgi:protein O-mannosyl-transferase